MHSPKDEIPITGRIKMGEKTKSRAFTAQRNKNKGGKFRLQSKVGKKAADFTRERKMGFKELVYFLLSMINESSQNALERYFPKIGKDDVSMRQQSFSEARQKLKWEAIVELFDLIVDDIYSGYTERWNGYRVMATGGSKAALPSDQALRAYFGTAGLGSTSMRPPRGLYSMTCTTRSS
jgi:hypothetical protein